MRSQVLLALLVAVSSTEAFAGFYLTGSATGGSNNIPYMKAESRYGSVTLGFTVGRVLRIGYTHSQELAIADGYTDPRDDDELASANATRADANDDATDDNHLVHTTTRSHVIGNSIDAQLTVYEGQTALPYIMGGIIYKRTSVTTTYEGQEPEVKAGGGLGPNLGAGVAFRISRQFLFKAGYITSPGSTRAPGDAKEERVWDSKLVFGLQYEI